MTAPLEVELKLELPPSALPQFRKLPLIRALQASAKRSTQVSVYFDSDKQKLRRHGLLLRVRRIGDRHIQTIKATQNSNILSRNEWESEIADGQPDLAQARGTALDRLLTGKFHRKLKPQFETRVRRTVFPLERDGTVIELALDVGTIDTGAASMGLCEIELELARGGKEDLFDVARLLARALPVQLALTSKSERGYRLVDGAQGAPIKFAAIALTPDMPARDAFSDIGRACLRQIAGNEPAVLKDDGEGVHQMRIGLRRLRTAISLFAALLEDPQTEKVKAGLKWLTAELGPARELDVLIARVVKPVRQRRSGWDDIPKLSQQFAGQRVAALARAREAIASERYRLLKIEIAAWLETGDWLAPQDDLVRDRGGLPIETFAAEQLSLRSGKLRKGAKSFAELDARQRHKLRIQAKKLRYATDFFGSLFSAKQAGKRRAKFLAALEAVQACLGDLNDIAVHESMISAAGMGHRPTSRKRAFAAGLLTGREDARIDAVMAAAEEALGRFRKAKPYWG
jgi:inorganic triphosphatase YgiF